MSRPSSASSGRPRYSYASTTLATLPQNGFPFSIYKLFNLENLALLRKFYSAFWSAGWLGLPTIFLVGSYMIWGIGVARLRTD